MIDTIDVENTDSVQPETRGPDEPPDSESKPEGIFQSHGECCYLFHLVIFILISSAQSWHEKCD